MVGSSRGEGFGLDELPESSQLNLWAGASGFSGIPCGERGKKVGVVSKMGRESGEGWGVCALESLKEFGEMRSYPCLLPGEWRYGARGQLAPAFLFYGGKHVIEALRIWA